jgi:hypothetical protein
MVNGTTTIQRFIYQILIFNTNYIVLFNNKKLLLDPFSSEIFLYRKYTCRENGIDTEIQIYKINQRKVAQNVGFPIEASLQITGNGRPIQSMVTISDLETPFQYYYHSKPDGSVKMFVPKEGEYMLNVSRIGFKMYNTIIFINNSKIATRDEMKFKDTLEIDLNKELIYRFSLPYTGNRY